VLRHRRTGEIHLLAFKESSDIPGTLTTYGGPLPVAADVFAQHGLELVVKQLDAFESRPAGPGEVPSEQQKKLHRSTSLAWVSVVRHSGDPPRLGIRAIFNKSSGAGISTGDEILVPLPTDNATFLDALERGFRRSGVRPDGF
jgi:hypothetical protein